MYLITGACIFFYKKMLLLILLCSNRFAEALVAYRNSLLNRLNIVHGGKFLASYSNDNNNADPYLPFLSSYPI